MQSGHVQMVVTCSGTRRRRSSSNFPTFLGLCKKETLKGKETLAPNPPVPRGEGGPSVFSCFAFQQPTKRQCVCVCVYMYVCVCVCNKTDE